MHLARASETDILNIIEISNECGLSIWSVEDFKIEIERRESLVLTAKIGEELAGFIVARFVSVNEAEPQADICNIGVKLKFQRMGIGFGLLCGLFEKASQQKVSEIWLEVRKSNRRALNFYIKNGFEWMQDRKNFYADPKEDAALMRRRLV